MDLISYNIATININTITNETKINALRTFVRTHALDIVFLQEVENDQLTIPGFNVVCNVDHSRRGTAIALKQHIAFSHVEKSLDGRLIALRINNVTLCNCYAPSGTNLRPERERFFNHTLAYYLRHNTPNVILAGDFNCVVRACDASGNNHSPTLQRTIQQLQLVDVWEKLHPRTEGPTYISHNSSARLDRIYVSLNQCRQLRTINTHVCCFSDHKAVTMRMCLPNLGREPGRGFWSLRPHLLTHENLEEFRVQWQFWTRQKRNYSSWMKWWIDHTKPKIKAFFRRKAKIVHDVFHREFQRLYTELQQAYERYQQDATALAVINQVKGRMLALQREFTHTFVRINEPYVPGEALSVFHIGERRKKRTIITHIRGEQNESYDTSESIERHLHEYYQQLYSEGEGEEPQTIDNAFECDRVVPENDRTNETCMENISSAEIFSAIRAAARRKSPGSDGIPNEFYLRTYDIIHRELNLVLNEALAERFPREFVNGTIVLVKKKGGDETVRSYRPISLLNSDYKLFSRILKTRLENVIRPHRILSNAQKCANPPNNIFQATLSIKDRVAQMIRQKQRGKLISFDLEHAYDRVRHSFLHRTMCSLGINRNFVSLLARISSLSSSRLLVNGHLSAAFPIERSVRQGDPISSLLFAIYLQPLVRNLENVRGNNLVVAYADDISIISTSTQSIIDTNSLFSRFGRVAGAKLNLEKTLAVDIGDTSGPNTLNVSWLRTVNTAKILGIIFANSIRLMVKLNWDAMVNKFSHIVWLHSIRSLPLHEKVFLLNTFATSKVWYLSSVLPPAAVHIAKLTKTMGNFLWRGVPERIPMYQLARSREKGGIKLQLPSLKSKALLLNRCLLEIDATPFYKSLLFPAIGSQPPCPADLPDVKLIRQQLESVPAHLLQNPSTEVFHRFLTEQTDQPRVERVYPNYRWARIWRNIASNRLSSQQKSTIYMIINEKGNHRKLYHTIGRADSDVCTHCNQAVETIEHKFSECPRVAQAWRYLQRRFAAIAPGRRELLIGDLLKPTLYGIPYAARIYTLKLFISYINFVNANERIDVNALDFYLSCEV